MMCSLWWKIFLGWRGVASVSWRGRKVFLARWRIALVMVDRVLFFYILRQRWWKIVLARRLERWWETTSCYYVFRRGWKIVGVGRLVLLQAVRGRKILMGRWRVGWGGMNREKIRFHTCGT